MAVRNALSSLRQIVAYVTQARGFEKTATLDTVQVVATTEGRCTCELLVTEDHQNQGGTLHGGLTSTLVDAVSTWALMGSEEPVAGVSVDMSISFLKPARTGETIVIDAVTLKRGKRLAFLTVDITNKATGDLLAQGKHTKFVG